jgi:Flp pilus assembly protein TadG
MKRRARVLLRDARGVAAIEFAVLAPVMAAILVGLIGLTGRFYASWKINAVAQTVADLAARPLACAGDNSKVCITASDMNDLFNAGRALLSPFDPRGLAITISEVGVFAGANGGVSARVIWSASSGGDQRACGNVNPRSFNYGGTRPGTMIVVDASFPYSSLSTPSSTGYAAVRNLRTAAVSVDLPIGHIRNESGMGTNCVAEN